MNISSRAFGGRVSARQCIVAVMSRLATGCGAALGSGTTSVISSPDGSEDRSGSPGGPSPNVGTSAAARERRGNKRTAPWESNRRGQRVRPHAGGRVTRMATIEAPPGHTPEGGVLIGSVSARHRLVLFEDLQCPYCRELRHVSGGMLRRAVGARARARE